MEATLRAFDSTSATGSRITPTRPHRRRSRCTSTPTAWGGTPLLKDMPAWWSPPDPPTTGPWNRRSASGSNSPARVVALAGDTVPCAGLDTLAPGSRCVGAHGDRADPVEALPMQRSATSSTTTVGAAGRRHRTTRRRCRHAGAQPITCPRRPSAGGRGGRWPPRSSPAASNWATTCTR